MTKTEAIVRSILGPVRVDIRPLSVSIDIAIDLLFVQNIPMDDILVTKDIYPQAALALRRSTGAVPSSSTVSRRVERLANQCWDVLVQRNLVLAYTGAPLRDIRAPRDIIFYLAYYSYLDIPFYTAVKKQPALLF